MIRKLIAFALVFAAGVATGGLACAYYMMRSGSWMGEDAQCAMLGEYADVEAREASYPEGRAALERYIAYLDSHGSSSDQRVFRFEKTMALSKLAILHERNGNIAAANARWTWAEALAAQGHWRGGDHSRNRLRAVFGPSLVPEAAPK